MVFSEKIIRFLTKQGVVIVSTIDARGNIHSSAKGIVGIEKNGTVFIMDMYFHQTYKNLKADPRVTITVIDEHDFTGYALQGQAKIVAREEIAAHLVKSWEERIVERITNRLLKSVHSGRKTKQHFEAHLPHQPKYLIEIHVEDVIDLTPPALPLET